MLFLSRLVEEADYKSTAELFAKKGDEKTLDNFIPKTESDFAEYAELVANKLRPYEVCDIWSFYPVHLFSHADLWWFISSTTEKLSLYWIVEGRNEIVIDFFERRWCQRSGVFGYCNCKRKDKSWKRGQCWQEKDRYKSNQFL